MSMAFRKLNRHVCGIHHVTETWWRIHVHAPVNWTITLRWRHNGCDSVSDHQPHDCLLNRSFRRRSKKTSKLRVTGLCEGNSPGTGEFPAQMASNAENVSIWWRRHDWFRPCIVVRFAISPLLSQRRIIVNWTLRIKLTLSEICIKLPKIYSGKFFRKRMEISASSFGSKCT